MAREESERKELGSVMIHLVESLRRSAVLLKPFLTKTPDRILEQLNIDHEQFKTWSSLETFGAIPAGTNVIEKGEPIFPRLDMEEEITFIKTKMQGNIPVTEEKSTGEENKAPEQLPEITIDDFMKVELRVAKVIHCEPVKKTNKLLKLQLDLGYEKRQVVSGIAEFYKPEDVIGRKVIVVTNLKPVKLRGELSQGMILAGEKDGVLALATVAENLEVGAIVK